MTQREEEQQSDPYAWVSAVADAVLLGDDEDDD